eukprot:209501-Alexandrium_andersonii.AAC.1
MGVDSHDVCPNTPPPSQPDAAFPARVQAALRLRRPHLVVHKFSKLAPVVAALLAEKPFVG